MSTRTTELCEHDRGSLERYLDRLYTERSRRNLTRVPREMAWSRHVEESLDLIRLRDWTPGERVLDLGSGGGIPGIPLAIVQPLLAVGLIERDQAKAEFLRGCLAALDLARVQVLALDALELSRRPDFFPADVVVSRAALPVRPLLKVAARLLRQGGEGLVHVGPAVVVDQGLQLAASRAGLGQLRLLRSGRSLLLRFQRPASA